MRSLSIVCLLAAMMMVMVGCVSIGTPTNDQQVQPNPFDDSPAMPSCPNCPDGNCPFPQQQASSLGQEIQSNASTLVNVEAANESKGQNCPNCPQRPSRPVIVQRTPAAVQPTVQPSRTVTGVWPPIRLRPGEVLLSVGPPRPVQPAASRVMPRPALPSAAPAPSRRTDPDIREGVFACQRCGRSTVGREWHEVWADDDTPLTCLCNDCWYAISPAERSAELQRFARGRIRGDLSPIIKDAIREASQK